MKIHFWAPLALVHAVAPGMRARRRGRIVNIASTGGKLSIPHLVPYSASKAALVGLSDGIRAELSASRVFVTTACPGLMRTGSHLHAQFKGQHTKEYAWFAIGNACPALSASVEEAAEKIIDACKFGDPEVTFPLAAKIALQVHGLMPGLTSQLASLINRFLPGPGGIGQGHAAGTDSQTVLAPSILTAMSDRAAVRNNEVPSL